MSGLALSEKAFPDDFQSFTQQLRETIWRRISGYLPERPEEYVKMVRSYVDRKGSYRRPSLLLLWSLLYGGNLEDALLPAAAQQASEDWMLIHDDWMDGNSVRRGLPAAHVLYGPKFAVNAGDTLHTITYKIAKDAATTMGGERGQRYFDKFYDMVLTTTIGQYYDLRLTNEVVDVTKFSEADYYQSIHAKSAYYSVYGPMQCGAIVAGCSQSEVDRIREYGTPAGYAFQIKDDVLDCSSSQQTLGKTPSTDVREGTKTLILLQAVRNASQTSVRKLQEIYSKPSTSKTEEDVNYVLSVFKDTGAIEYADREATRFATEALEKFDNVCKEIPESKVKGIARDSIGHLAKRKK